WMDRRWRQCGCQAILGGAPNVPLSVGYGDGPHRSASSGLGLAHFPGVLRRSRKGFFAGVGRFFLVMLTAGFSASLIWGLLDNSAVRDRDAQRSALQRRAGELTAQALAQGSSLACLDALAGETVQAACERTIFATPANVASAVAYVAAQYGLLSDMSAFGRRGGTDIGDDLVPLRRALEADPF